MYYAYQLMTKFVLPLAVVVIVLSSNELSLANSYSQKQSEWTSSAWISQQQAHFTLAHGKS